MSYLNSRGRLDESNNAKMAAKLMETRIRVKPNNECRVETKRLVDFNPESMICGFEYNRDACQVNSHSKAIKASFCTAWNLFVGRFWWTFFHRDWRKSFWSVRCCIIRRGLWAQLTRNIQSTDRGKHPQVDLPVHDSKPWRHLQRTSYAEAKPYENLVRWNLKSFVALNLNFICFFFKGVGFWQDDDHKQSCPYVKQ